MASVEPKFYPDPPEPDAFEMTVRAVCGALLGLVIAFFIWAEWAPLGRGASLALFAGAVAACAWAAMRYGDEIWRGLAEWVADGWRW